MSAPRMGSQGVRGRPRTAVAVVPEVALVGAWGVALATDAGAVTPLAAVLFAGLLGGCGVWATRVLFSSSASAAPSLVTRGSPV